jgi:hypothetical protein
MRLPIGRGRAFYPARVGPTRPCVERLLPASPPDLGAHPESTCDERDELHERDLRNRYTYRKAQWSEGDGHRKGPTESGDPWMLFAPRTPFFDGRPTKHGPPRIAESCHLHRMPVTEHGNGRPAG